MWEKENQKALKKGKGLYRANCIDCGFLNVLDAGLVVRVIQERSGATAGKLARWADRQIEEGARLAGKHSAAELARMNRMNLSEQIQYGLPCAGCGEPLVR
jgi:hypothetical protein